MCEGVIQTNPRPQEFYRAPGFLKFLDPQLTWDQSFLTKEPQDGCIASI